MPGGERRPSTSSSSDPFFRLSEFVGRELAWGRALTHTGAHVRPTEAAASFLRIPLHMERFTTFGHAMCADLFLFHFTLLPLRFAQACLALLLVCLRACVRVCAHTFAPKHAERFVAFFDAPWTVFAPAPFDKGSMYALVKVCLVLSVTGVLGMVQLSYVYHYIRGEAIIKLYVIFNILEILDKLFASLGQDVLDALYRHVRDADYSWPSNGGPAAQRRLLTTAAQLVLQLTFAVTYVTLHSVVIFVQIVCLNVAINSRNNALLTLLVSNNFVELKGSVFKRFEAENLFQISCSDAVERFQLSLFLVLIALQEATSWEALMHLLPGMLSIFGAELLVDYVKHSFICKFNRLDADLYSTYSAILAHDMVSVRGRMNTTLDPTHARSRRLGLATLPLASVVLRMVLTNVNPAWFPRLGSFAGIAAALFVIFTLASAKLLLSMSLLAFAADAIRGQREKLMKAVSTIALTSPQLPPRPAPINRLSSTQSDGMVRAATTACVTPPRHRQPTPRERDDQPAGIAFVASTPMARSSTLEIPAATPTAADPLLSDVMLPDAITSSLADTGLSARDAAIAVAAARMILCSGGAAAFLSQTARGTDVAAPHAHPNIDSTRSTPADSSPPFRGIAAAALSATNMTDVSAESPGDVHQTRLGPDAAPADGGGGVTQRIQDVLMMERVALVDRFSMNSGKSVPL